MTSASEAETGAVSSGLRDLYAQRDFLLASLDDLERERADADMDDVTYRRLRDDYTARAAAVLRAIEAAEHDTRGDVANSKPAAAPRMGRRLAVAGGIVAFVAAAGFLLANALGDRVDGGTATGNQQTAGNTEEADAETLAVLEAAVERNSDDPAAHLELARFVAPTDPTASLMAYDEVVALDPVNAEAHAYGGWIVHLAGLSEEALERVDRALAVDPEYPDALFFRGMILFQGLDDPAGAVVEFDRYLEFAPDGPLADQVRDVAATARAAAGETTGVPAP